ncbi:vacuolar sorting protein [Epithele typhae]|uniref:vacuolar sorting protein n=1 Tax=Epithele typhae TaxID=378194 RepID=UPI0020082934|nr:vacuolar sorting protein [Epithele typhae]KAH9918199.1 vacuolar sorting protein [Epithele typhae]
MCTEAQLRAREFVELHEQVQTSVNLLDSLEGFLSTFQKDLSAVSGQISNLQDRSKDIDNRLKSRRKIEKPLSNLIADLSIPPALATLILDTRVDDTWIPAIMEFKRRLDMLKFRVRVKAARDMSEVAEGLRIVAATKLRTFFLSMLEPIRSSMTTNLQVLQTSVWMKYRPLFVFLQEHAANVANEVQRTYISTVRTFYETGFRRYLRGLGWVKARVVEKAEPITSGIDVPQTPGHDPGRLAYAKVDGPSVTMAYVAEDKNCKEPLESVLRSALLVLMDNATAEYTFITTFFASEPHEPLPTKSGPGTPAMSPPVLSPTRGEFDELRSGPGSEIGSEYMSPRQRVLSISGCWVPAPRRRRRSTKEEQTALNALWKQALDPVLDYVQTFIHSSLDPPPPAIPLSPHSSDRRHGHGSAARGCGRWRPSFSRSESRCGRVPEAHGRAHRRAPEARRERRHGGYFRRGTTTTNEAVAVVCRRYVVLFNAFIALTDQSEETMIFANLLRLRQELVKLISASAQSKFFELLLQGLSNGPRPTSHPKAQSELAYWRERDEECRRRCSPRNCAQHASPPPCDSDGGHEAENKDDSGAGWMERWSASDGTEAE